MCLCNKTSEYTVRTRSGGEEMVNVQVYGTKVICASCVGMPSSTETFEWLQAAIGRKYEGQENKFNLSILIFKKNKKMKIKKHSQSE